MKKKKIIKKETDNLKSFADSLNIPFSKKNPLKGKKRKEKIKKNLNPRRKKHLIPPANNLKFIFNLNEFSLEEIAEIISHISHIYELIGGDRLIIHDTNSFQYKAKDIPYQPKGTPVAL